VKKLTIIIAIVIILLLAVVATAKICYESDCKKRINGICADKDSPFYGCSLEKKVCARKYIELVWKHEAKQPGTC